MTVRREVQKWSSLTVRDFQESGNRDIIGTPGGITPTGVPVIVPDIFFGDTSRSGGYMKEIFIRKLSLERVRNLPHIEIPLSEEKRKHLILTGKNGSGKTTVLEELAFTLSKVFRADEIGEPENQKSGEVSDSIDFLVNGITVEYSRNREEQRNKRLKAYAEQLKMIKPAVEIYLNDSQKEEDLDKAFASGEFIIAYYKADRKFAAEVPKHVAKIELQPVYTIQENPRKDFVKYLLDLKMTQALAASGGKEEKAQEIQRWFDGLEHLLRTIFENDQLKLAFDEDTFRFSINEPGKDPYDFNTLSSGYAAIMDVVVDIMIRMERYTGRKFQYNLQGIVLIDEIEAHLHLELQKTVMKLLTTVFPNIQFIVSTHSPFVLNSLEDAVIYDLEQKILVQDGLSDIPYDGIVEGYFKADLLSDKLKEKFARYKELVKKKELSDDDFEEIAGLEMYLDEIPDYLALGITTEYQKLKLEFARQEDI